MNLRELLEGVIPPTALIAVVMLCTDALYRVNMPLFQYIASNNLQYHPAGTGAASELSVSLIYAVPVVLFTFGMAYIVKKKRAWLLPLLMGISLAITSGLIVIVAYWWSSLISNFAVVSLLSIMFLLSMSKTLMHGQTGKAEGFATFVYRAPYQLWLGTGTAMIMVLLFPTITLVALVGLLAIWDLYAVLRGPLKVIAGEMKTEDKTRITIGKMLMVQVGKSGVGMGDIVFYSIVTMIGLGVGEVVGLGVMLAILVGVFVTFALLRSGSRIALPGLPLPVLLAFIVLGVAWVI